ncbi:MAG: DNA primase [Candidatus Aenigmarchaeota archaeon]|nr:DNA primase [Candidatus Aenigmarchaeota archaeon]
MAKLAQNFAKYLIHARLHAKGIVEKPDIIGAIFGQTEGLLGADMDLRELQRTGRIGRIEVDVNNSKGKSYADIYIPSSLDASETSLIAASMETIDKVGPCDAEIEIAKVNDVRTQKRKYVIERAKEILKGMMDEGMPDTQKLSEMIKESVRSWELSSYYGLPSGPDILESDEIIIVEGRADVINLLKNGIRNVMAIEGSKIPDPVIDITKQKTIIAFLDGDRGGDLDLKKLLLVADIDYVARAEEGKEVEELTKKEIFKALREKTPVYSEAVLTKEAAATDEGVIEEISRDAKQHFGSLLEELTGSRAAYIVDKSMKVLAKIPLSEISAVIDDYRNVYAIVFDGKISQDIIEMSLQKNIPYLVATDYKEKITVPESMTVITQKDLEQQV